MKSGTASLNADKRLVLHVRLRCGSKCIAQASELGSCQSNLCDS